MTGLSYLNPLFLIRRNPQTLIYFVTAFCNCRCKMCFFLKEIENCNTAHELTLNEIEQFSSCYGPVKFLSLSGGEPFSRKDLAEVLKIFAVNNRPKVIDLPTNASYTRRIVTTVKQFCENFPAIILNLQLSLDGPESIHDSIRNFPGLYKKVVTTNRELKNLSRSYDNLRIQIVTVYSSYNKDHLEDFFHNLAEEFYFHRIILSFVHGTANPESFKNVNVNHFYNLYDQINEIHRAGSRDILSKLYLSFNKTVMQIRNDWEENKNLGKYCQAGKRMIVLGPKGEVFPCEPLWYSLGNIREYDYNIHRLLADEKARRFLLNHKNCHCSWSCAQTTALLFGFRYWFKFLKSVLGEFSRWN